MGRKNGNRKPNRDDRVITATGFGWRWRQSNPQIAAGPSTRRSGQLAAALTTRSPADAGPPRRALNDSSATSRRRLTDSRH